MELKRHVPGRFQKKEQTALIFKTLLFFSNLKEQLSDACLFNGVFKTEDAERCRIGG
jgi:hypothetical protein